MDASFDETGIDGGRGRFEASRRRTKFTTSPTLREQQEHRGWIQKHGHDQNEPVQHLRD
jgi:hypothetical protein